MAEKIFPKGVTVFAPHPKAPSFIRAEIMITPEDFNAWLQDEGNQYYSDYKGKNQIKLQVVEISGKLSVQVNTYKKEG